MNPPSPPRRIALRTEQAIESDSERAAVMPVSAEPNQQCLLSRPPGAGSCCEQRLHTDALASISVRARNLSGMGATRGRTWTLADACEHLTLGIEVTVRGSDNVPPPRRWLEFSPITRFQRWIVKRVMLATGRSPSSVPAPISIAPTGTLTLPDALDRLQDACEALEQKCASPGASWGYHSILGKMSGASWRRIHLNHAAHHFAFFRSCDGQ